MWKVLPHQQIFNHLPHFLKFVIIQLSSLVILNSVKDIPKQYLIFLLSCKQITRTKPNIWAPGIGRFYLTGHFWVCPGLCIKTRLSALRLIRKWFSILMQIKHILTRKVVHLASFWKWGFWEHYEAKNGKSFHRQPPKMLQSLTRGSNC